MQIKIKNWWFSKEENKWSSILKFNFKSNRNVFLKKLSFGKDEEKKDTYFQENMELGTWIYCWWKYKLVQPFQRVIWQHAQKALLQQFHLNSHRHAQMLQECDPLFIITENERQAKCSTVKNLLNNWRYSYIILK